MNRKIMLRHIHFKLFMLLTVSLCALAVNGQTITVKGTVIDGQTKEPLTGVTVREVNKNTNGTVTDIDGNYTINVSPKANLLFTYMGYANKQVAINGRRKADVEMSPEAKQLEEFVVIGYGVQRKSDVTGSISSVSGKEINDIPVSSTLQALQGRAAGVNIIQNTGAPGSATTIKIRGTGTINDADPLYIVDGFVVGNIDYLNPNDIENIEIFKDAASSAVYGSRAANGVVAITTKSGKEGKNHVVYDGYIGMSRPWRKINVMGIEDFALMQDYIHSSTIYSTNGQLYMTRQVDGTLLYDKNKYNLIDTVRHNGVRDWWDAIIHTGLKTQHGISVSGGTDKLQYLASGSYFKENGIVKTSEYDRTNGRLNIKSKLSTWLNMSTNMAFTHEGRNGIPEGSSSILKQALYESPLIYLHDAKGYWYSNNPLAVLNRNINNMSRNRLDMNLSLDAKILKLLSYQFKFSYYTVHETDNSFTGVWGLDEDFIMPGSLSQVHKYQNTANKWEMNNLLTFNWSNANHKLTVLAGQTAESYRNSWQQSFRSGTPSNESIFHYLSSAYTGDKTYGLDREWTALGLIGRINYSLHDIYLLQFNVRADGSSMFAKGNRWGIFPSISLGWRFSQESFMKNQKWLSNGKLRIGWGLLGNNRIDELSRYTYLTSGYNYSFGLGNETIYEGSTATVLGNNNIKWEKNESWNVGLDLGFLNNRLTCTLEYFNRKTTDMLLRVPTVSSAGLDASPMTNAGDVKNYGLEADVKWQDNIGKDWRYQIGFNISWIKNKVTKLGTGNEPIYGSYLREGSIVDYVTKTAVGQPIGSFFGYVTDGIFNSAQEVKKSAQYEVGKADFEQTYQPGDFRFKDLNGDNKITAEDRTYLGSPLPKFIFGIPITVGYKNFDFALFFQGQSGNKIFNVMEYYLNNAAWGNVYADLRKKHWAGQITGLGREYFPKHLDATIPDLSADDVPRNFRASNFYIKDGSYIRLKQVQVTYSFPLSIIQKLKVGSLSLSLTGYNLLTLTKYNGFDPEVGRMIGTENNNLNMGVDHGNYPQARSFTFGIKLGL